MTTKQLTQSGVVVLIIVFCIFFVIQINQAPFERYPNWDFFWVDVRSAGRLVSLMFALKNFELPSISPYYDFGWNVAGEPTAAMSFLSLPNLLIMFFPANIVLTLRIILFLSLGGIGAYLYLNLLTGTKWLSLLGGLTYISIPFVISMHYTDGINVSFLSIPLVLLLVHKIFEKDSARYYILLVTLLVFVIGAGDVHSLVILPSTIGLYSLAVGCWYYRVGVVKSLSKAFLLVFLCVLSASFYILPLYANLREISAESSVLRTAGIMGGFSAVTVESYLNFFRVYGLETLYKPMEGSKLLLYVPAFFYFVIVIALALRRQVFKDNPRQAIIPFALALLGMAMFAGSLLFYSLPSSLSGLGRGVFRYQLNLIPFVIVLAGFICFAVVNQARDIRKEIYLLVAIGSGVVDWMLFNLAWSAPTDPNALLFYVQHTVIEGFKSSNLVPVRFWADMWPFLPWLNLSFVVLLFVSGLIAGLKPTFLKRTLSSIFILGALFLPLLNISVHNELRATQQSGWQMLTRNPYRWESYLERKVCIDGLIDRSDPNYRTLPAGKDIYGGSGRNWKLIAETELNVQDHEKMLFSYRETLDPYTSLLYSTFGKVGFSNWIPPMSSSVAGNIQSLRLMGVGRVISADEQINSPDLIYKGQCVADKAPPFAGAGADGTVYVYEMWNPLGVAFLADDYELVNRPKALKTLLQRADAPWARGIVYLETDPTAESALSGKVVAEPVLPGLQDRAEIIKETFNSVQVNVSAPASKFLVLSYLFRPNWKAYLGNQELTIYRAYGGFMAVQVPAGQHIVAFKYTPVDVYLGLTLTALAFVIPVLMFVARSFRKRVERR